MMSARLISRIVMISLAFSALSGCRSWRKSGSPGGASDLQLEVLEGDYGLGTVRDEFGTRLTDVLFTPVYFDYDRYKINSQETAKIEQVAAYLNANRDITLVCEGHCDERGSNEYNLSLGENRALAVRAYLINIGIDAGRLHTRSYGEEKPASQGTGESAWRLNRRVEFGLYR